MEITAPHSAGVFRQSNSVGRAPETTEKSERSDWSSAVSVTLSKQAQSSALSSPNVPMTPAQSARAKLDADYAKAIASGTSVVRDTAYGGRHLDVSGLSDEELAAVRLDSEGLFSRVEGETAGGELGQRAHVTLAPFAIGAANDPRGYLRAIQLAYEGMSPAVRDALGWDQSMIDASRQLIERTEHELGPLDEKSFLEKLLERLEKARSDAKERGLELDISAIRDAAGGEVMGPARSERGTHQGQLLDRRA